jgi:hypothetical protein
MRFRTRHLGAGIFLTQDPGSGMEKFESWIRDKHSDPQHCVVVCSTALFKLKISILKFLRLVSHLCNCVPIRAPSFLWKLLRDCVKFFCYIFLAG